MALIRVEPYSLFALTFERLEANLKRALTVKKPFWCDSHPRLCTVCHKVRHIVKYKTVPETVYINTKRGVYVAT